MESRLKTAINSLLEEMSMLKGITTFDKDVDYETCLIPFSCDDIEVVRFLAQMGFDLVHENKGAAYVEINVLPPKDKYLLKLILVKAAYPEKVVMSLASTIDAAACDVPQFYRVPEEK